MSSSQPFQPSSPLSTASVRRRKSRFTYRHLAQLALSSTSCPLRVIAHADLDAFYAQCEMVRLGVAEDVPLAVQQWNGLIAIGYPAREYGLNRHVDIQEARKLCPQLIMQHVATWKEGDETWAYHDDAAANIGTHKVSLDPYRRESRKILACIKDFLPADLQKVEKASVDEVFIDLSAQVHSLLLKRYPELGLPAPYDDPTENLPMPPTTALDWDADALVDLDTTETEESDPDWDDIAILIGSEIIRSVRAVVRERLKYTMSAGIAQNKMLAKLGSAYRKPNQQTVIRNRAVQQFLSDYKFTKIRNLGGKLGDDIVTAYNTDSVKDLLRITLDQLKSKFGPDMGTWIYSVIRGIDTSEVNSRTQIKSMLSAKSFRPSINTPEQASKWLRIFVADIYSRLVEEGVNDNKRRPKTINLHYRSGGQTRSRQAPIPQGKSIDETLLFELTKNLLGQIILEGRVWPCANLSLSVGGFEDGVSGNMGISAFLVKGEEAKSLNSTPRASDAISEALVRPGKRRRVDDGGISRFFSKSNGIDELQDDDFGATDSIEAQSPENGSHVVSKVHQQSITRYVCERCNQSFNTEGDLQSHGDWHFAKDLQDEDRVRTPLAAPPRPSFTSSKKAKKPIAVAKKSGAGELEKGQSKLNFG